MGAGGLRFKSGRPDHSSPQVDGSGFEESGFSAEAAYLLVVAECIRLLMRSLQYSLQSVFGVCKLVRQRVADSDLVRKVPAKEGRSRRTTIASLGSRFLSFPSCVISTMAQTRIVITEPVEDFRRFPKRVTRPAMKAVTKLTECSGLSQSSSLPSLRHR